MLGKKDKEPNGAPVLYEDDQIQVFAGRPHTTITPVVHRLQIVGPEARFAEALLERMALNAGADDGEDSAGRQRIKHLSPAECVDRACSIAQLAYEQFAGRGWLKQMPKYEEFHALRDRNDL